MREVISRFDGPFESNNLPNLTLNQDIAAIREVPSIETSVNKTALGKNFKKIPISRCIKRD
jgi:hypothetical protein